MNDQEMEGREINGKRTTRKKTRKQKQQKKCKAEEGGILNKPTTRRGRGI